MKIAATLISVQSRKDAMENIIQKVIFELWGPPEDIARINELYKKPLKIEITEEPNQ